MFGIPIPLLRFVLSLVLMPFDDAFVKFTLKRRRQKRGQATEVLKDGLDIVYEGSNAEVE